ncbi:hypothetical protein [Bradyrhizobium japonicum]|uniref:hypothetical protein n=1 Tax=Bradyrhizobium japonicum TaxID=375 RepID=UPI001AEF9682|nr:hypothetical protein [Bradyrhizobium japonicum]
MADNSLNPTSRGLRMWINQVDCWFAELTGKQIEVSNRSVRPLDDRSGAFIDPRESLRWTKSADRISVIRVCTKLQKAWVANFGFTRLGGHYGQFRQ